MPPPPPSTSSNWSPEAVVPAGGAPQPLEVGTAHRHFGLDLARALAIVFVLLAHTLPGGHLWQSMRVATLFFGYFGVELFFLLSGFLIGGILLKSLLEERFESPRDLLAFWQRRWFRTLPNYYLFLVLTLLVARTTDGAFPVESGEFFWFGQALCWPDPAFFSPAWSLAVEEWFYLLFPLALLGLARVVRPRRRAAAICIAIFLAGPLWLRWHLEPADWDSGLRRVTLPRLDAITYGVLLALVRDFRLPLWNFLLKCWPAGLAATAGLTGCWIYWSSRQDIIHMFFFRVWFFSLTSLGLALVFPRMAELKAPHHAVTDVIRKLSLWSYSIYLSHTLFESLIIGVLNHFHWPMDHSRPLIISSLMWVTSLPASAWLYHYFEKPVMDLRDRPFFAGRGNAPAK